MKAKIDIISGFLGSGKTTLIKKLISEKLHKERLVLIENEFGEVGIDGTILKESNLEIKEINSGCICCTLTGDFEKAIEEVVSTFCPERIIIEPSGVGKLSDVVRACKSPGLKDKVVINILITVVDLSRFHLYISNFSEFYKNQIEYAKTIILSRTKSTPADKSGMAIKAIRQLNGAANIISTPWDEISAERIISVAEQRHNSLENELIDTHKDITGCHICHEGHHEHHEHHEHPHKHSADEVFDVIGVETHVVYTKAGIEKALASLENQDSYGMVLRAKGIIQVEDGRWIQFDYVPGEYKTNSVAADYTGRLAVIGRRLNKENIGKLFEVP
ncbi:MAG: CobW family GTP-binding protein [Acetivibrionales bacterium]|jgi:G3E family GTPase